MPGKIDYKKRSAEVSQNVVVILKARGQKFLEITKVLKSASMGQIKMAAMTTSRKLKSDPSAGPLILITSCLVAGSPPRPSSNDVPGPQLHG